MRLRDFLFGMNRHQTETDALSLVPFSLIPIALAGLATVAGLSACSKKSAEVLQTNGIQVEVLDHRATSGCEMVFRTRDGKVLVPVGWAGTPPELHPGDMYRLQIRPDSQAVYACTLPGEPVTVLAHVREKSGVLPGTGGIKPEKGLCAWTLDPYRVPWMVQIIKQTDPDRITRYKYREGAAYLFASSAGFWLFDGYGRFICQAERTPEKCLTDPHLVDPEVILVRQFGTAR